MSDAYPFNIVKQKYPNNINQLTDFSWINQRPFINFTDNLEKGAEYFIPNEKLLVAINTTIAIGEPLIVTGEPGTGKTQVAYYIAYKLSLDKVLHFQTKSTSKAQDLLYTFDTIRYFHDANQKSSTKELNKSDYIIKGLLWIALESKKPRVLLIDEIDKASRDFPNDLLRELDQNEFIVPELGSDFKISCSNIPYQRPIVIITSNSERRLPEPFLRRCLYHYIEFDELILKKAVNARKNEYPKLSKDFLELAIKRVNELRQLNLRKKPSTSELLTWIRILYLDSNNNPKSLEGPLSELPHLEALLKDHSDFHEIGLS